MYLDIGEVFGGVEGLDPVCEGVGLGGCEEGGPTRRVESRVERLGVQSGGMLGERIFVGGWA